MLLVLVWKLKYLCQKGKLRLKCQDASVRFEFSDWELELETSDLKLGTCSLKPETLNCFSSSFTTLKCLPTETFLNKVLFLGGNKGFPFNTGGLDK